MNPPLRRLLVAALVAAAPVAMDGCKRQGPVAADAEDGGRKARRGPRLPDPFPLPAEPELALFVRAPGQLMEQARAYADAVPAEDEIVARMLEGVGRPEMETKLAPAIDVTRPWVLARMEGETIVALPVTKDGAAGVQALLSAMEPEGKFGAVRLPVVTSEAPAPEPPILAWFHADTGTLYFAETLRGLATGPTLEEGYGKQPLYGTVAGSMADVVGQPLPFERLTVSGSGPAAFEARLQGLDEQEVSMVRELANGALTGLARAPQVAWSVSTRWSGAEDAVGTLIADLSAQVAEQNFLVRGVLEDLLRRFNAVLRSWNGRVLLGSGPANHVLLALGTDDAPRAERAVLHFTRGVLDNLKLADTFGLDVPSLRLNKGVENVGEVRVHELSVRGIAGQLPPEMGPLLDGDRMRIAMAFPPKAGVAIIVTGPEAAQAAARWVRETDGKVDATSGADDLASASFAIKPESLRPVVEQQSPLGAVSLDADRPPTVATLRREGKDLVLRVRDEGAADEQP